MFKCPCCKQLFNNLKSLCLHWTEQELKIIEQFYLEQNNLSEPPTCKCGCGGKNKFISLNKGYSLYLRGHNNVGHSRFTAKDIKKSI
jgi:hypothetical protein